MEWQSKIRTGLLVVLGLTGMISLSQAGTFAQAPEDSALPSTSESACRTEQTADLPPVPFRFSGSNMGRSLMTSGPNEPVRQIHLMPAENHAAFLEKSGETAFILSLLLPGQGQRYGERSTRGAIYTAIDISLWSGLFFTRMNYLDGRDRYRSYARQHAGVNGTQTHDFYVDIGNYNSRDEFNAARRAQRSYDTQYDRPETFWQWDTSDNRRHFKDMRINADRNKNYVWYMVGGLILNRVVSAIDAATGLSIRQKDIREQSVSVGMTPEWDGVAVTYSRNF